MAKRPGSSNRVRIIGGEWGGRRLGFPDAQGLRPTADRVRETLFNWLQHGLQGRRVLDAFAGSGALGIEAASRGAREVVMLERSRKVADALQKNLEVLEANNITLLTVDAFEYMAHAQESFDLILLDPPFGKDLIQPALALIKEQGLIQPEGKIYIELEASAPTPKLPEGWAMVRDKVAGDVRFGLIESPE